MPTASLLPTQTSLVVGQPPSGMPTASLLPTQTSLVVVLPWRPGVDAAVEHKEYRDTEAPTVTSAPTATTVRTMFVTTC